MFKVQVIFLLILIFVLGKFSLAESLTLNTVEMVNNIVEFREIDVQQRSVSSDSIIFQSSRNKSDKKIPQQLVIVSRLKFKLNDDIVLKIISEHQTIRLKIQTEDILNKSFWVNNFLDNQFLLFNPELQNFNLF